jgi:DNA-binding transcriptional regulator GbsR (MarR family)
MAAINNEPPSITFLKALYRHCEKGFINLRFLPSAKNYFIPLSEIESVPGILESHKGENSYFGVATRVDGDGTKNGILQIPALWVELDDKGFSEEKREEIRQRFKDYPLKVTASIGSGGGSHVYWLLKEPASPEEILRVENLLKRLALYFNGDRASTDASRILRIPGTLNHKYSPPRKVTVKTFHSERQYLLDDFEGLLPELEEIPKGEEGDYRQEVNERLQAVMECEFLKHCDRERVTLSEPEWYAMVSILARETGGPNLIHSLSKGYPKYSPEETDKKILHAVNDAGPATCERIKNLWGCGKDCRVSSPAVLAYRTAAEELRSVPNLPDKSEHHFSLIEAKDLLSSKEPDMDWLWEGILPCGGLSLVVAKPKVGKTTLAFHLAVGISEGREFLGRRTNPGIVVYLALEEKMGELQKALSKMGITGDNLYFHFGPAPAEAMSEVAPLIKQTGAVLLVIDILQKFCRVRDLNDYAQVTRALEPLMATARQLNCHILLVHHAGKRDRDDGDDILGSTGLLGGVDTSIHIKKREKRRTFFTIQRYGQDVPETVLTLNPDGSLQATGSRESVEIEETLPLILQVLEEGPLPEKEIWERIEKGHSLVSKGLRNLVEQKLVRRTGIGKRGSPFIYEKDSLLLSSVYMGESRREMKSEDKKAETLTNISPDDFQKNELSQERIRRDIQTEKEGKKALQNGLYEVTEDGQLTY